MNSRRKTSLLTKTRPFENPHLEINALRVFLENEPRMFHEGGEGDPAGNGGLVAGIIDEVDGAGLGHEIDGGDEEEEEGGRKNLDGVQVEGAEEGKNLMRTEAEHFEEEGENDGDEEESEDVVDEVLIAEFDIFEFNGGEEVGKDCWRRHGGRAGGYDRV